MKRSGLFELSARNRSESGFPTVVIMRFAESKSYSCAVCGARWSYSCGPRHCEVSSGKSWFDVISASTYGCVLVSERFIDALSSINARGFRVVPATVELYEPSKGPTEAPPRYFALEFTSYVRLDAATSCYDPKIYCSTCLSVLDL